MAARERADDGYEAQQWAATQPWSNGQVVTYGNSYLSIAHWLAAMRQNPHLKGMVSIVGPSDVYEATHVGGASTHALGIMWAALLA